MSSGSSIGSASGVATSNPIDSSWTPRSLSGSSVAIDRLTTTSTGKPSRLIGIALATSVSLPSNRTELTLPFAVLICTLAANSLAGPWWSEQCRLSTAKNGSVVSGSFSTQQRTISDESSPSPRSSHLPSQVSLPDSSEQAESKRMKTVARRRMRAPGCNQRAFAAITGSWRYEART
jgi:hypothetical protein